MSMGAMSEMAKPESSSQSADSVTRPSLYVHSPRARSAPLEEYYGARVRSGEEIVLLDELKTGRMEGVYNLSFLVLGFSLMYLFVRNVGEGGWRIGEVCWGVLGRDVVVVAAVNAALPLLWVWSFALIWAVELLGQRGVLLGHYTALGLFFAGVAAVAWEVEVDPLCGVVVGIAAVVVSLKAHSWVVTNLLLREETIVRRAALKSNGTATGVVGRSGVPYPTNVSVRNMAYFCVAPTLVYETGYPRTAGVRWRYVGLCLAGAGACAVVQWVLLMQFCAPVWAGSGGAWSGWGVLWSGLKLALPGFFIWLLLFFGFFHCVLNVLAEVTMFADRAFYGEWWNATTLGLFWKLWNTLVHEWCLRHLYVESVERHGSSRAAASFSTFFASAIMHEYVAFVAFRLFRPYMFLGMMLQIPLMRYSERLFGTRSGNCLMWSMLFIGQSAVSLLYVRDYLKLNGTLMC